MNDPRNRSRILVVALLLFMAGTALAWNHTYRRATAPRTGGPVDDRFMVFEHGGRIVAQREAPPPPNPRLRPAPAPRPNPDPIPSSTPKPGVREVEVRPGDTLSDISERVLGRTARWKEIAELNGLTPPYRIYSGRTLKVPAR